METLKSIKQPFSWKDPKKRLEWLTLLSSFIIGYFYIYVYQTILHINVEFSSLDTLLKNSIIVSLVLPLIYYLIIRPDPLQRSPSSRKAIRFYQSEFPSLYILERCNKCMENQQSCKNKITQESFTHVRIWFNDIFNGKIKKENEKAYNQTFEKGYTCKLNFYLFHILVGFAILSLSSIGINYLFIVYKNTGITISPYQIIFPVVCMAIAILIKMLNNPDFEKPSGCWHAWREINRNHISWLRENEELLVKLICQKQGQKNRFQEK